MNIAVLVLAACRIAAATPGASSLPASGECAFDDAALVQRRAVVLGTEGAQQVPDLGKLANRVTGAADAAAAKANELAGTVLFTAGNAVNSSLSKLQQAVEMYAAQVNATSTRLQDGVSGLLAEAFDIPAPEVNVSKADRDRVVSLVRQADDVVQASLLSLTRESAALDAVPRSVFSLTRVNSTLQAATLRCKVFSSAVGHLRQVIEDVASKFTASKKQALLQASSLYMGSSDVVHLHAALMSVAPAVVKDRLVHALRAAGDELEGCTGSFAGAFDSLSRDVAELTQGKISSDEGGNITAVFSDAKLAADAVARDTVQAFRELFSGIAEGAAHAGLPNTARGAGPARGLVAVGLLAAAAARLAVAGGL